MSIVDAEWQKMHLKKVEKRGVKEAKAKPQEQKPEETRSKNPKTTRRVLWESSTGGLIMTLRFMAGGDSRLFHQLQ
jgi:hypothetical protein